MTFELRDLLELRDFHRLCSLGARDAVAGGTTRASRRGPITRRIVRSSCPRMPGPVGRASHAAVSSAATVSVLLTGSLDIAFPRE